MIEPLLLTGNAYNEKERTGKIKGLRNIKRGDKSPIWVGTDIGCPSH